MYLFILYVCPAAVGAGGFFLFIPRNALLLLKHLQKRVDYIGVELAPPVFLQLIQYPFL